MGSEMGRRRVRGKLEDKKKKKQQKQEGGGGGKDKGNPERGVRDGSYGINDVECRERVEDARPAIAAMLPVLFSFCMWSWLPERAFIFFLPAADDGRALRTSRRAC